MFRDMVYAVAIGQIVPGDKEDMARTAFLNEAHAVDGAEIGGDENTGANVLHEVKRKAALCKKFSGGIGSTKHGGWQPSMGGKAKNTVGCFFSPAGTRTRVFRVRAEYPNQLDYRGDAHRHC